MKTIDRGEITRDPKCKTKCQGCGHAKKGALLLKCSEHKCSVLSDETCDRFKGLLDELS